MLARTGRARLAQPGGDFPTRRTITTHLQALTALGGVLLDEPGHALAAPDGLKGASFYLYEASVTGTETALLAAAAAKGPSEIRHAAMEPHVVELCRLLSAMGVHIDGEGTPTIRVEGGARLRGARLRLHGDYIEAGSWGVVAAITGGEVEVTGARGVDLEVIASPLRRMGLRCKYDDAAFAVLPSKLTATRRITTGLWPGFPSDMVSLVTVLATQADGRTLVHDWLYELRLFALEQLSAMRADLFLCDPHRIIVSGPTKLRGRSLDSRDLRSGMALIAAALAAEGESHVSPVETVERGYASLVDRLISLGANVARE
jgi:UDP-N-acetylglucosamine 1-carboxyvinyltransferase